MIAREKGVTICKPSRIRFPREFSEKSLCTYITVVIIGFCDANENRKGKGENS